MNKLVASLLSAVTLANFQDVHGDDYIHLSAAEKSDIIWSNLN